MSAIKGFLFDFNGTLFFDSPFHIMAFKKYFVEHGKEEPSEEYIIQKIFGRTNLTIYTENFNPNATPEEIEDFTNAKEGLYRSFCLENPHLMKYTEGATELLDYLKENGIPYCLATGSGMDNLSFYIEYMGLGRWFDESNMVYFDGSFPGKPEPDTYLRAANKIGLDASECVIFEDGTSGMIAARRAGAAKVICVCERSLPSPVTEEATPDALYDDFTKWKEIVDGLKISR